MSRKYWHFADLFETCSENNVRELSILMNYFCDRIVSPRLVAATSRLKPVRLPGILSPPNAM
jgi:hypothetical protein